MVHFEASVTVEAAAVAIRELGAWEQPTRAYEGQELDVVARLAIKTVCSSEAPHALRFVDMDGRNAVRRMCEVALFSLKFMAIAGSRVGPLPAGLEGRSLGYAALALYALKPLQSVRRTH